MGQRRRECLDTLSISCSGPLGSPAQPDPEADCPAGLGTRAAGGILGKLGEQVRQWLSGFTVQNDLAANLTVSKAPFALIFC